MMQLSRLQSLHSKKRLIGIVSSIALLLVVGGYALWSKQVWAELTPTSLQWHQSIKADVEKAAVLSTGNEKARDVLTEKLTSISQKIDQNGDKICTVNGLVEWQRQIIATFKDTQDTCREKAARVVDLGKKIDEVLAYLEDEQELAKIISSVPQVGELADDNWEKQMTAWENVVKTAEKMTVMDNFKPIQQLAVTRFEGVKTAWQELIVAHQAKDKQKYLTAQNTLASAIDRLNDVPTSSQQAFAKLSSELEAAAHNAFVN